jgi:hypothetical protein
MEKPAAIDIRADRWVACIRKLAFVDMNFAGASFSAQIRAVPDALGSPLVSLGTVGGMGSQGVWLDYAGTALVSAHIAAGRLREVPPGLTESTSVAVSVVGIRVNEATMEALEEPVPTGADLKLAWDLHITPSGGVKDKYAGGTFLVRAGVTR